MNFRIMITLLKINKCVRRNCWPPPLYIMYRKEEHIFISPCPIDPYNHKGYISMSLNAEDIFADDWEIYEDNKE